ncbi:permease [Agromyces atrinae]|uniref:FtsX-like permease family protein n=1 Tax=Agromyces atrinae TaxID=592376 RepID=UPI001F572846|nr:FtsX-like permease family protein [Agromyces atrinae]MCI2956438.1 permease [Agromyces atrinae]
MTFRIAWLLARPGTTGAAALVLPIVAFGVVTALLLTVIGGAQSFWTWTDDIGGAYQFLAVVALVLLVVPLASLGGSAARLSARRRDDRLATLRLLGATTATVTGVTVLESVVMALVGVVTGILGYLALVPLVGLIPFRGEALGAGAVLLHPAIIGIVAAGVVLLAAISALLGLRSVVISPLGVRTRQDAPRLHWVRVVVAVGGVAAAVGLLNMLQVAGSLIAIIAVIGIAFGATLALLGLVGPWVIGLVARSQARRAKTAVRLLAARATAESPKAAWRQVSGVAMTSFMAVFAGVGIALTDVAGSEDLDSETAFLFADIRTGVLITVVASFLMVACSVGVIQSAEILDRRDLYASLSRFGMAIETMDAARRRSVMSPLRITALGSAVCAAVVMFPLTGLALIIAPLSLAVIAGVLAAGLALVWLGLRATRAVLTRVAQA